MNFMYSYSERHVVRIMVVGGGKIIFHEVYNMEWSIEEGYV